MFSEQIIDELLIIAQQGAEKATGALTLFLRKPFAVRVTTVTMQKISTIPDQFESEMKVFIGLLTRINGTIEGNAALFIGKEHALDLMRLLGSTLDEFHQTDQLPQLEQSMLEEIANITISSFMNSFAGYLNRPCVPGVPLYVIDIIGAMVSELLLESAEVSDYAIFFSTHFECKDANLKVYFIFLPNPSSYECIQQELENAKY